MVNLKHRRSVRQTPNAAARLGALTRVTGYRLPVTKTQFTSSWFPVRERFSLFIF